jgi:glycosyltransferase involved in cell wall biosynthesis
MINAAAFPICKYRPSFTMAWISPRFPWATVPAGTRALWDACARTRGCWKQWVPLRIAAKMHAKDEQDYYHDVVEPVLGSQEEFLGELSDPEKYELMGGAMAMINPIQWHEPFGLVMIESLATGTPVLSTPMGAAPEIVQHGVTGYLAQTNELAGFVQDVQGLSRAECRRTVDEYFNAARMASDHLELYATVIEEFKAGGLPGNGKLQDNQRQAPINL